MKIPGTQKIDVNQVTPVNAENELFCFCVHNLDGSTYLENFLQHLDGHLPLFVFSKEVFNLHQRRYAEGKTSKTPLDKAREFLQKTKESRSSDSGELGEFLLYLFAKEVKGAHKLVSKIQSRGSVSMTIPGMDSIYIWESQTGEVYMLLGEAKMRPDSNTGLREAQADMNRFWGSGHIQHEVNLASSHLRSELTEDNANIYEAYFIDDNPQHRNLKYKNIIFVGYSFSAFAGLVQRTTDFNDFKNQIISDLQRCFTNQAQIISESAHSTIYCFVPFESIDIARDVFVRHNLLNI